MWHGVWLTAVCRDDVGDHARWASHFKAQRILHADEVVPDTQQVEVKLTGEAAAQSVEQPDESSSRVGVLPWPYPSLALGCRLLQLLP
jgi:hypothetical protein